MTALGIIGTGTIFPDQIAGLAKLADRFELRAIYDSNADNLAKSFEIVKCFPAFRRCRLCTSFEEFLSLEPDSVLIATPPKTHFDVASSCIKAGKNVLIEKPAVLSTSDLDALYSLAKERRVLLHVAYHASFAADLLWYLTGRKEMAERYHFGDIEKIICGFYDPYVSSGKLIDGKEKLEGSYIDSGVNALSVSERLIPLEMFCKSEHREERNSDGVVLTSNTVFSDGERIVDIDTGWLYGLNRKITVVQFCDSEYRIMLDHSDQAILLQAKRDDTETLEQLRAPRYDPLADGNLLFIDQKEPRLHRHYYGVFIDLANALSSKIDNHAKTGLIHRLLLEKQ